MGIEIGLSLRQTQRLAITPMLQAAIKLLQLSRLELLQVLNQHVMENPLLEEELTITAEEPPENGVDVLREDNMLERRLEKSELDCESYLESASDSYSPISRE